MTTSLCPTCLRPCPAEHVERDGAVYLARTCPRHGTAEALVSSDADWYRWSRRFLRPGRAPAHRATETDLGCPYDCGLCPEHQQHACVTVFEITEACNLECPACFAGDAHVRHGRRGPGRTNVFMNGVEGPGPMGFQPSVFDSRAGAPEWSPYWDHMTYAWAEGQDPRILTSEKAVHAARDSGDLEEFPGTPDTKGEIFTVNCPVPVLAPNTFES